MRLDLQRWCYLGGVDSEWTLSFGSLGDESGILRERLARSTVEDRLRALEALRAAAYDEPESPPRLQ